MDVRYSLTRRAGFGSSSVLFVMLNPSTADAEQDDPTIRRCIGFANAWDYGWLEVANLSPCRATDPKELIKSDGETEEQEKSNHKTITLLARQCDMVVVAWGNHGVDRDRNLKVLKLLRAEKDEIYCLGTTNRGHPKHPLYVPQSTQPVVFNWPGAA